jgi:phosphoenolpyruvate phosphomutase
MISSKNPDFIMEAHNGLSAKIVEEAGFKGIWASGLSISASLGVRDNNEASWTQVLDVLEFMSDATSIPILLDGDTGYGNFNNARRLVKKLEQRNIAGVCIEDKLFPKINSFINGESQPLADVEEFCGKIKAMKDTLQDDDFVVVTRVEAFIAGWGLNEALRRAEAYRQAGADAILIHSKRSDITEIEAFMKEWNGRHPVVIVPTKYYATPTHRFHELGVSLVIWANHNVRASIDAMKKISRQIYQEKSLIGVEGNVATVDEIFRLQGVEELQAAEKKYLPSKKIPGDH